MDLLFSLFKKQKQLHKIFLLKKKTQQKTNVTFSQMEKKTLKELTGIFLAKLFPHQFSSHKHRRENNLDQT